VVEDSQVERAETQGVGDHVDLGDLPTGDREAEHSKQPPTRGPDESHRPVDERQLHESGNLRECECPCGPVPRPTDLPRRTRTRQSFVYSHHDIWVEYREKAFEVTAAQGSEEGVDHISLLGKVGIGNRGGSLHAAARRKPEASNVSGFQKLGDFMPTYGGLRLAGRGLRQSAVTFRKPNLSGRILDT
jgi:hypothetical protein